VTRAHGEATGAPYYFVRLTFNELKRGNSFLGGTELDGDKIFVHGTIREGRPQGMKDALMGRLTADVAIASQMQPNCVWIYLSELPLHRWSNSVAFFRCTERRRNGPRRSQKPRRRVLRRLAFAKMSLKESHYTIIPSTSRNALTAKSVNALTAGRIKRADG